MTVTSLMFRRRDLLFAAAFDAMRFNTYRVRYGLWPAARVPLFSTLHVLSARALILLADAGVQPSVLMPFINNGDFDQIFLAHLLGMRPGVEPGQRVLLVISPNGDFATPGEHQFFRVCLPEKFGDALSESVSHTVAVTDILEILLFVGRRLDQCRPGSIDEWPEALLEKIRSAE
jgi:hypothetical protein